MKALLFVGITTGAVYASLRWDIVAYCGIGLLLTGGALVIFYSLYRHLAANRLL
jgi:hypothetical protein